MNRSEGSSRKWGFRVALLIIFSVAVIVSVCLMLRLGEQERELKRRKEQYTPIVLKYAEMYSLDPTLVLAVIDRESGFDPMAVSHAGACGLMQIMPTTFEWLADDEDDIFDAEANIKIGCKYLAYLFDKFESAGTALAAYNAGEGNVSDWLTDKKYSDDGKELKAIPFPETADYVSSVLRKMSEYRDIENQR